MGFMSKIKNILFEEEEDNDIPTIEETSEVRPKVSQVKTKQVEEIRFKQEEVESVKKEEEKQSPFQTFDEEEFDKFSDVIKDNADAIKVVAQEIDALQTDDLTDEEYFEPEEDYSSVRFCIQCGKKIASKDVYCKHCGAKQ